MFKKVFALFTTVLIVLSFIGGCSTDVLPESEENVNSIQQETTIACASSFYDDYKFADLYYGSDYFTSAQTTNNYDHYPSCYDTHLLAWRELYSAMDDAGDCNFLCLTYVATDWSVATNKENCENRHMDLSMVASSESVAECVGVWNSSTSKCTLSCNNSNFVAFPGATDSYVRYKNSVHWFNDITVGISAKQVYSYPPYTFYSWSKGSTWLWCSSFSCAP